MSGVPSVSDIRREIKNKPFDKQDHMSRKKTSQMVENHLHKQRNAYDQWIAELCRDAEESAMERDRLKAKLEALRADHKRKIMAKIIGRLSNMTYYVAWNQWYTTTVKEHQTKVEKKIRDLRAEHKTLLKETAELETEAQRRADEAAKLAFGAATDSQKQLVKKILTKLCTLKARLYWGHWYKQAFYHKHSQKLMTKIIKRLYNASLTAGFTRWMDVSKKWHLVVQIETKEKLVKELEELEKLSKQYKEDFEKRQSEAAANALARASGQQRDLMVKILSKLTGDTSRMVFMMWKRKADEFGEAQKLMTKVMMRLINIKIFSAFRHWFKIVFNSGLEKTALREALLKSQMDNLSETLKTRAQQLRALQGFAQEMLSMSRCNQDENAHLLEDTEAFNIHLYTILDKGYLEKQAKARALEAAKAREEGREPAPIPMAPAGSFRAGGPPPAFTPSAYAPAGGSRGGAAPPPPGGNRFSGGGAPSYGGSSYGGGAPSYGGGAPSYGGGGGNSYGGGAPSQYGGGGAAYGGGGAAYGGGAQRSQNFSPPPARSYTTPKPKPKPQMKKEVSDLGPNVKAELIAFVFELEKKGLVSLPKDGEAPKIESGGINSPVQRHIRGRENWEAPKETYLVPELEKMVGDELGGLPGSVALGLKQRAEKVLKPLAMAGDSRLYAAMKAYKVTNQLNDLLTTLESLGALPPAE